MNHTPSLRSIREGLFEFSRQATADEVSRATLRQDFEAFVRAIRRSIDRATDFATRGLVCEAASVIEDFPDLAAQAEALRVLAGSEGARLRGLFEQRTGSLARLPLPTQAEVDAIAGISMRAEALRAGTDAYRLSVLRGEPLSTRLRIVRQIRAADPHNRMWLEQMEALEVGWLAALAELARQPDAARADLEHALAAIATHAWIATVPRGLKEALLARVEPLRAVEADARFAALAREIHDAAARMDREELVRLEAEWARTNTETGRMPAASLASAVEPAFAWLTRLDEEDRARRAFDGEVEKLEAMLVGDRPAIELERQIAVLRDARREAPEGLVERAHRRVEAERIRLSRRHRVVVLASVSAAIALGVLGVFVVRMATESTARTAELAALNAAIEAKDVDRAGSIATAIRARGGEVEPAIRAALDAEAKLRDARAARTDGVRRIVADVTSELERRPTRARTVAIGKMLADARGDALEPERLRLDALEARRVERLAELDLEADRFSKAAVATADEALRPWKLPSAWRDEAQLDPNEWTRYIAALESARRTLDDGTAATAGFDAGLSRLALKIEAIDARLSEAKARHEELVQGLRETSAAQLCAPVSVETDFIARLAGALERHGALLARQRTLKDFEVARDCASAWEMIARWRDETRPQLAALLGPRLDGEPDADKRERIAEIVDQFNGRYPNGPFARALRELAARVSPGGSTEALPPAGVADLLGQARLADLEEVALVGGRSFYRRPGANSDPRNRAVENLADLALDPEKLDSILSVKREDIAAPARPVANEVSVAWAGAIERLRGARPADARTVLLELMQSVAAAKSDPLLRLRAARELCTVLDASGATPTALVRPLAEWQDLVQRTARAASAADWARAAVEPSETFRAERRDAEAALARLPDLSALISAARAERAKAAAALLPLAPVGILAPAGESATREIVGRRESGRLVVVVRAGGDWDLLDVQAENGVIEQTPVLPRGPVLVFRRLQP